MELIDSIPATDSQDAWCVVDEYAKQVRGGADGDSTGEWLEVERVFRYGDEPVLMIDDTRFRIVATGEVLTRQSAG